MDTEKSRVYVSAFFCTDVIRDKDTDFLTAIKIVNAFTARPVVITPKLADGSPDPSQAERFFEPAHVRLIVSFVCEQSRVFDLSVKMRQPSGEFMKSEFAEPSGPCNIGPGASGGLTLNIAMGLDLKDAGEHWLEIYIDGEAAAKLPFLVIHPNEDSSPVVSQPGSAWQIQQHVK